MPKRLTPVGVAARALAKHLRKLGACKVWEELSTREKSRLMKLARVVLEEVEYDKLVEFAEICHDCGGIGYLEYLNEYDEVCTRVDCPTCNGTGKAFRWIRRG